MSRLSLQLGFILYASLLWFAELPRFTNGQQQHGSRSEQLRPKILADTYWINATFRAEDGGLNLTQICQPLRTYWASSSQSQDAAQNFNVSVLHEDDSSRSFENETTFNLTSPEPILWIRNKTIGEVLGLNTTYFDLAESVAVNLGQVCLLLPRILWINSSADARHQGLNTSVICLPFRKSANANASSIEHALKSLATNDMDNNDDDDDFDPTKPDKPHRRRTTKKPPHRIIGRSAEKHLATTPLPAVNQSTAGGKGLLLNISDEAEAVLIVRDHSGAEKLDLDPELLHSYESIGIDLPTACKEDQQTVTAFNASQELGVSVDQNIGIDVSAIEGNLDDLREAANNDTDLDNIIKQTNGSGEPMRFLGGSYILPLLKKVNYDKYTAPAIFENQTVVVKVGFYVESISDFNTQSMDYEMDIYFRMAWRDPRLANSKFNQTINIKEQEIRDQLWLPDAYFPNAKDADFHEVTFLNFVMHVLPTGEVLYTIRIKLQPSCHLVLCKFPHDIQQCGLRIQSFAYPTDQLRFEWFTDLDESIELNPNILFSELSIDRETGRQKLECDGANRIGNFTCLEAQFTLTRDLGYYIAQMYVPTTLALMFAWVGVWLPEELMEGRLSVAITVLLTLSTDSVSSQEHLPTVSYMKAIDIWFAFITAFVFFTMIQTLFVIGFDRKALTLRKRANRKFENPDEKTKLENAAERYHKLGRYLDHGCRLAYPLAFLSFCAIYFLVITQGPQDSCISKK